METTDVINLVLACATIVTAFISILILIVSLKQNGKMLENATRPNINIYGTTTYYSNNKDYYLIIRNYGNSSGKILSISCDIDLSTLALEGFSSPFLFIKDLTLSPNQGYSIVLNDKIFKTLVKETISITLEYEGLNKVYKETTILNIKYLQNNVSTKWNGNSIDIICGTIQDFANKRL